LKRGLKLIGIVFINDIGVCPYLAKYIDSIEKSGLDYHVITWDRDPAKGRTYPEQRYKILKLHSEEYRHPVFKLKDFIKFKHFAGKLIKENKYEKLIILTSLSGIFLYRTLLSKYKQDFIFDYRDASYEFLPFYKKMLGRLIEASYFTCISSRGFLDILPPSDKYIMAHNFQYSDLKYKEQNCEISKKQPIQVNYIGFLRGNYLLKMIDLFAKDKRFVLNFHGGGEILERAMKHAEGINNIKFTGEYRSGEKLGFIRQADLICYNYESSYNNDKALANKYYDSLIFKKPLLGNIKTYSGRLIAKSGLGISLDIDDPDYTQKVYNYYINLDCERFNENAEKILAKVLEEDSEYIGKIKDFLTK
jgi:hypothetical protein